MEKMSDINHVAPGDCGYCGGDPRYCGCEGQPEEFACAICRDVGLLPVQHWGRLGTPLCCDCAGCETDGVHDAG